MLPNLTNQTPDLSKPKFAHETNTTAAGEESQVDESLPRGQSRLSSIAEKAYDTITGGHHASKKKEEGNYYDVDAGQNYNLSSKQHDQDSLSPHLGAKGDSAADIGYQNRADSEGASQGGVEVARVDETGASTTARPAKEGEIYANYTYTSMVDPVISSRDVEESQKNVKNLERNRRQAESGAEPNQKNAQGLSTPNQYEELPDVSRSSAGQSASAQGIVLGSNTPFYDLNKSGKDGSLNKRATDAKDSNIEYQRNVLANTESNETSKAAGSANTSGFQTSHAPFHDSTSTTDENYAKYHIPGTKSEGIDTIPKAHGSSSGQQNFDSLSESAYNANKDSVAADDEIHVKDKFSSQPLGAALTQLDNQGLSHKSHMEHIGSNDVMKTSAVDELQNPHINNQQTDAAAGTGIVAGIIDYLGFNEEDGTNENKQTTLQDDQEFSTNEVPGGFSKGYNDVSTGENVRAIKSDILKTTPENQTEIPTIHSKSFDTYGGHGSNLDATDSKFDRKSNLNSLAAGAAKPVDHVEDPTAPSIDISHHTTDQYAHNLPKMVSDDLTFQGGNMPEGAIPVPPTKFDDSFRTIPLSEQAGDDKTSRTSNKDILADAHTDSTPYRFVQDKPEDIRLTKKNAQDLVADKSSGFASDQTESTPYRFVQNNPQDERLTQKNASGLATDKSASEVTGTQLESTPYRYVQNNPQDERLAKKDATGLTTDKDALLFQSNISNPSGISPPFNVEKSTISPDELKTKHNTASALPTTNTSDFNQKSDQAYARGGLDSAGKPLVDDKLAGANTESTPYSYVHANAKDDRLTKLNANELKLDKEQPSSHTSDAQHSSDSGNVKGNTLETSKPFISAKNIDSSKKLGNENDASSTAAIVDPSDFKGGKTTKDTLNADYSAKDPYANYTEQYDDFYEGHDQDLANARPKQFESDHTHTNKQAEVLPVSHKPTNISDSQKQDSYMIDRFNSAKHDKDASHSNTKDAGEPHGVVGKVKKLFKKDSDHHQQQQQHYTEESALNDPGHRSEAIGAASAAAGAATAFGSDSKTKDTTFGGVPTSSEIKRSTVEAPNARSTEGATEPHSSLAGNSTSKNTDKLTSKQLPSKTEDEQFASFTTKDKANVGNFDTTTNKEVENQVYKADAPKFNAKNEDAFANESYDTTNEPSQQAVLPDIDTTAPSNAYNPNRALGFDPNTYAATGDIVNHSSHGHNIEVKKFESLESSSNKDVGDYNAKKASNLSGNNSHNLHKGSDVGDSTVKEIIHGEIPKKNLEKEGVDFKHSLKSMLPGDNKNKHQKAEKTPEGKTIINERGTVYTEAHQEMGKPEYINQETKTYTLPTASESNPIDQDTTEGFSEGELVDHHPADENLNAQQGHKKGLLNRIKDKITN